jgi:5'-3' exonuclease
MHGSNTDPSAAVLRATVSLGWPAVHATISVLRKHGIPNLVAPYEADSQLALLAKACHVWAVATVDAYFIIHGIQRIFFVFLGEVGGPRFGTYIAAIAPFIERQIIFSHWER